MTPKEIIDRVRTAVEVLNASPNLNVNIDLDREDKAVLNDFIAYCKDASEDTAVPAIVNEAWSSLPNEWLEGKLPEPTEENGYNTCQSFGKQSPRAKACKACQKKNSDEHLRCAKATEVNKKSVKAPAEKSRYGHQVGSKSAFVDDRIVTGINESELVKQMREAWPDMTEDQAVNKIRSHISWLPRVRGVLVQITRSDEDTFYKATVDHWCGDKEAVIEVKNEIIDQRTKTIERVAKKAEKKAKADGEKKAKEAKAAVKKIKSEKPAKATKPSKATKPAKDVAESTKEA